VPVENNGNTQMCEVIWPWRISGTEPVITVMKSCKQAAAQTCCLCM